MVEFPVFYILIAHKTRYVKAALLLRRENNGVRSSILSIGLLSCLLGGEDVKAITRVEYPGAYYRVINPPAASCA